MKMFDIDAAVEVSKVITGLSRRVLFSEGGTALFKVFVDGEGFDPVLKVDYGQGWEISDATVNDLLTYQWVDDIVFDKNIIK